MTKAAFIGSIGKLTPYKDGTMGFQVNIEPNDVMDAMALFRQAGTPVVIARPDDDVVVNEMRKETINKMQGDFARDLKLSSFFRSPEVWSELGSDEKFLSWIRKQQCCNCGINYNIQAAHVRRIANGAGISIKPDYSAIPLCGECHSKQHQSGESALKINMDSERIKHVQNWAWQQLKSIMNVNSMKDLDPDILKEWCQERDLVKYLPKEYI